MNKIKKIYVNKSDEPTLIAEKIIDTDANEVVLNIPKFSKIADSLANFHLIKREAEALDKKVIVESVDDKVIELCGISGIEAVNPFFVKSRRQFSDIVIQKSSGGSSKKEKAVARQAANLEEDFVPAKRKKRRLVFPRVPFRKGLIWAAIGIAVISLSVIVIKILPRAEVSIITKKINWEYKDTIKADKALAAADIVSARIPGQLFSQTKNMSFAFPATGRKEVAKKAGGIITVYNAYSSEPQPLVARTRFETPDGKTFRLVKELVVPGAKVVNGQITPSSIDAEVIADQAGPSYNIGPVEKYTIPGFKGSPKYKVFYGSSANAMTGGFIGESAYPLDSDIKKAKTEATKKLEDSTKASLAAQVPQGFKILEGASEFVITKQNVIDEVDANSNFSVFVEGQLNILAFRESDLENMLVEKAKKEIGKNIEARSFELAYTGVAKSNFKLGQMTFPIVFTSILVPAINQQALTQQVMGKTEMDLQTLIFSLPDIESAQISLWPFWVKTVPTREGRIKILVD